MCSLEYHQVCRVLDYSRYHDLCLILVTIESSSVLLLLSVHACRSADERTSRDGTRRSTSGSLPVSVNSSAVKRLFTDDGRLTSCGTDSKRHRREAHDAEVFTLNVRIIYSIFYKQYT